jgi:phosphoribosylanthranilate isomerase
MTRVKICGIRTLEDARCALSNGAHMLGFIFYRPVPRYVDPARVAGIVAACRAEFEGWQAVGVFVNEPAAEVNAIVERCGLDLVQLAGEETPAYCQEMVRPAIKVLRTRGHAWTAERLSQGQAGYALDHFMVDSHVDGFYGGTGVVGEWQSLAGLMDGHILAGGLRPDNVAQALELTRPWGVDVSTGVETDGRKDPDLIRDFLETVRACDLAPAPFGRMTPSPLGEVGVRVRACK